MMRTRLAILSISALMLGAGCATHRPFSDADDAANALAEGTPAQVSTWLRGLRPATHPVAGGELLPLTPLERRFEWTLNGEPSEVIYRIDPPTEGVGGATISWTGSTSESLISLQRVSVSDAGALVSRSTINADRAVETRFNPPLPILVGVMSPGAPHTSTHEVLVSDMDRPGRIAHRGRATSSIELVGETTIGALGREVRCVVVRTSFDATFGPAKVKRISYQWYEPGVGLVAEYADERVRTLGVETDARREFWVAME